MERKIERLVYMRIEALQSTNSNFFTSSNNYIH